MEYRDVSALTKSLLKPLLEACARNRCQCRRPERKIQEGPLQEGTARPLQNSCLENPMDTGAWRAIVHGVAESDVTEVT